MNSADLITSFFNNELSPDQERQFLVSVASSDSMRLGLKSHVMLDKILIEENQQVEISPAIRRSILKEAAVVAAAAGGASSEAFAASDGASSAALSTATAGASSGFFGNWLAIPATLLVALGSFFFGYSVADDNQQQERNQVALSESIDPAAEQIRNTHSSFSLDQLVHSATSPVAMIADRLARSETSATEAVASSASLDRAEISGSTSANVSGFDGTTDPNGSVQPEGDGSGSALKPGTTVNPGTTLVKKGKPDSQK